MSAVRASRFVVVFLVLAAACAGIATTDRSADATVTPRLGYRATVDGFTSWYGSYDMGPLGPGWCIDHGIPAPDPALDYVPTEPSVAATTRTAMAWLVGRHGYQADRITAAAMMLALHDLMGAMYPSGRLDVDQLSSRRLAGFGDDREAVLSRARELKAEATHLSDLVGPFGVDVEVEFEPLTAGEPSMLTIHVTDAAGRPVPGAVVLASSSAADLEANRVDTDDAGVVRVGFVLTAETATIDVHAVVPDLDLAAFAPSLRRAQRVVVPGQQVVAHRLQVEAPPTEPRPARVSVLKTGDATDVAPITGARFELRVEGSDEMVAEFEVDDAGMAGPSDVAAGPYELVETAAPPGYLVATPIPVDLEAGQDLTIEVHDLAAPGSLRILKSDATTGEPIAGAVLEVFRGSPDGPDASLVATFETATTPTTLTDLAHGIYWVVERTAPTGYVLLAEPVSVEVPPGGQGTVTLGNERVVDVELTPPPETPTPTSAPPTTGPPQIVQPVAPPASSTLPRTGAATGPTVLIGSGLVFFGIALTVGADVGPDGRLRPFRRFRRPLRRPSRRGRARSSGGAWRTRQPTPPPSGGRR